MKIAVDENIPASTVAELREQGHDVLDIRGTADQGMTDDAIWQKALAEERLLITTDKGFAEHRDEAHYGILIIRLSQPTGLKILSLAKNQSESKSYSFCLSSNPMWFVSSPRRGAHSKDLSLQKVHFS